MPDIIVKQGSIVIPESELTESFSRSGGPGGQNVNKVNSKAELRWTPRTTRALSERDRAWLIKRIENRLTNAGELVITSDETRDQHRNREDARRKLADLIRTCLVRPKRRKKTKPSRAARKRRLDAKKRHSQKKKDRRRPVRD
jgi:ribosome-associated protein